MTFTSKYALGQIVYLSTDPDQLPRMVVAIQFTADGGTVYTISMAGMYSEHYEIDLATSVNHSQKFGINSN